MDPSGSTGESIDQPRRSKVVFILGTACSLFVGLAIAAWMITGSKGLTGVLLGTIGTGTSMVGTWMAVQWVGKILRDDSPQWQASVAPIAVLAIKLPVILAAMSWALRLGPPAPAWFLAGLALVYSVTVWWAVSRQ